jgi:hypothetical protein
LALCVGTLRNDLAEVLQPGRTGRHFLGYLVLVPESVIPAQIAKYRLIDGQQRLTTLSLVLCGSEAARPADPGSDGRETVGTATSRPAWCTFRSTAILGSPGSVLIVRR